MKLLVCVACNDVFNLNYKDKSCSCGKSKGKYLKDGLHAEYEGPCIPLGFRNDSFHKALREQPATGYEGKEFTAFVIQRECPTMKKVDEHYWNKNNPQPKIVSEKDIIDSIYKVSQAIDKSKNKTKSKKPSKTKKS